MATKKKKSPPPPHPFWGELAQDRIGFKPAKPYELNAFPGKVEVYLGVEDVDDHPAPPSADQLGAWASVFAAFLSESERYFAVIRDAAFARYQKLYARYYEDPKHHTPPLGIRDAMAHAKHLGKRVRIRVFESGVVVSFWYELDREHGLEFRFSGRELAKVGGFSDT